MQSLDDEGAEVSWRTLGISIAIMFVLFTVSIYAVLPRNVFSDPRSGETLRAITQFWPQGWGFFTKDPDSPSVGAYDAANQGHSLLRTPQGRVENLFGISREARAQGPELAILSAQVGDGWTECSGARDGCFHAATLAGRIRVANSSPIPTICGDIFLTVEEPVPWAYRELVADPYRVTGVASLSVLCSKDAS